jgi:hypothetical protein
MQYPDQYVYPRPWTRAQLAPGVPDAIPFAALYGQNAVGQQFRCCCDRLSMLRVWLGGASGQRIVLSLRTSPERSDTLYAAEMRLDRDGYYAFSFPPLLEAPDAGLDAPVAMRAIPTERVGGLVLLNEYATFGNLDFATYHRGPPGGWLLRALGEQVLPDTTAVRLRQYKPSIFKGDAFGWLLLITGASTCVWLVLSWPGERRSRWQRHAAALALGTLILGVGMAALTGIVLWPTGAIAMRAAATEASAPQGDPRLVHDLLLDLYPAHKRPERRTFATTWTQMDDGRRPCIAAPPDSRLSYGLRVPLDATLRVGMALEAAGSRRRFEVSAGDAQVLLSRELAGPSSAYAEVDLERYGGQEIRLRLQTVGDGQDDAPGLWCMPQISSPHSWLRPYPLPPDEDLSAQRATFGETFELLGYRLERTAAAPGSQLALDLYWHARRRATTSYTVFVHLLDEAGQVRSQHDGQPVHGAYPTHVWSPEAVIVDRHVLSLPADVGAGTYQIVVGLYDLSTLERLPAVDAEGTSLPDSRVRLQTSYTIE